MTSTNVYHMRAPIHVPKEFYAKDEIFALHPMIASSANFIQCANMLADYIKRMFGMKFSVVEGTEEKGICLCVDEALDKEAYSVLAEGGLVCVRASETGGFSHGCATILQMTELCGEELQICAHEIHDCPDISRRGLRDVPRCAVYPYRMR